LSGTSAPASPTGSPLADRSGPRDMKAPRRHRPMFAALPSRTSLPRRRKGARAFRRSARAPLTTPRSPAAPACASVRLPPTPWCIIFTAFARCSGEGISARGSSSGNPAPHASACSSPPAGASPPVCASLSVCASMLTSISRKAPRLPRRASSTQVRTPPRNFPNFRCAAPTTPTLSRQEAWPRCWPAAKTIPHLAAASPA